MLLPVPIEYKDSLCEIRSKKNEIVAKGILVDINEEFIKIRPADKKCLVNFNVNQPVKINVYNKLEFAVLVGFVSGVDGVNVTIVDVVRIVDHERRNHFRVEVSLPATIDLENENDIGVTQDEKNQAKINAVFIKDLSLNGTRIQSKLRLSKGNKLWISFNVGAKPIRVKCVVVRRMLDESKKFYHYGCQLEFENESDNDRLCAYLFKVQRQNNADEV